VNIVDEEVTPTLSATLQLRVLFCPDDAVVKGFFQFRLLEAFEVVIDPFVDFLTANVS
jgi:hypothetical protein